MFSSRRSLIGLLLACAALVLVASPARATNYIGSTISWEVIDGVPTVRYTVRVAFRQGTASPGVFEFGDAASSTQLIVFDAMAPFIQGPPVIDADLGIETWTVQIDFGYSGEAGPFVAGFSGCCRTPTIDLMNPPSTEVTDYAVFTTVDLGAASSDSPIYTGPLALTVAQSMDASELSLAFDVVGGSTPDTAVCAIDTPTPPGFVSCSATCMSSPVCLQIGDTSGELENTSHAVQLRAGLSAEATIVPLDLLLVIVPPVVEPQCEATSATVDAQMAPLDNDELDVGVGQDFELIVRGFDTDADVLEFETPADSMNSGEVGLPPFAMISVDDSQASGNPAEIFVTITGNPGVDYFDTQWPIPFVFEQAFGPGGVQMLEEPCTFTIVIPPNQAPTAQDDPNESTPEDTALLIDVLLNDTDPEGLPLTIGLCPDGMCDTPVVAEDPDCMMNPGDCITTAEGGTARIVTMMMGMDTVQLVEYTPPANFPMGDSPANDSFAYRALDSNDPNLVDPLQSNIATVTISVSPQGDVLQVAADSPAVVLVVPSTIMDPAETTATNTGTWTDGDNVAPDQAGVTTELFDPVGMMSLEMPFGSVEIDPGGMANTWSWTVDVDDMMAMFTNVGFDTSDEVRIGFPDADPPATITAAFDFDIICPPGDANRDGTVTFADITAILANFLTDYSPGTGLGDADGNGVVNFGDVTTALQEFNLSCPLSP